MASRTLACLCLAALCAAAANAQAGLTPMEMANSPNIGDAPPGSPAGCNSPYAVLLGQADARIFGSALAQSDLATHFRFRNMTGTVLVPTDVAFNALANQMGLVYGQVDDSILKSIVLYHTLQADITVDTLRSLTTTGMPYQTFLAFNQNNMVPPSRSMETSDQLFTPTPAPMTTYQNVTVQNQGTGASPQNQYVVNAAQSQAHIYQGAPYTPVRTCSGFVYRIDNVLLPTSTLTALSTSNPAAAAPGAATTGR